MYCEISFFIIIFIFLEKGSRYLMNVSFVRKETFYCHYCLLVLVVATFSFSCHRKLSKHTDSPLACFLAIAFSYIAFCLFPYNICLCLCLFCLWDFLYVPFLLFFIFFNKLPQININEF